MESDMPQIFRVLAAFVFVMALMGGFLVVLRKMGLATQNAGSKRLKLVEILPLDSKRRLAIIQRDSKQHLVILGPTGETLIESGIESPQDTPDDKGIS